MLYRASNISTRRLPGPFAPASNPNSADILHASTTSTHEIVRRRMRNSDMNLSSCQGSRESFLQADNETHPNIARAKAVASKGSSGAAVMKAHAIAVTEQPPAVILDIMACPLDTLITLLPSVICRKRT